MIIFEPPRLLSAPLFDILLLLLRELVGLFSYTCLFFVIESSSELSKTSLASGIGAAGFG